MASKRVCRTSGCPNLIPAGRSYCTPCARARDAARGTREQRGYGKQHQATRRYWQARMDSGAVVRCWRCNRPLDPTAWHLGHDDHDRTVTRGPECVDCNLRAAGRASAIGRPTA